MQHKAGQVFLHLAGIVRRHSGLFRPAFACLLTCSLLFFGQPVFVSGHVRDLTVVSDTISTSAPGRGADHEIRFTTTQPVLPSGQLEVLFSNQLVVPAALDFQDVDVLINGRQQPLATIAGTGAGSPWGFAVAGQSLVLTLNDTDILPAQTQLSIRIGSNATYGGTGTHQVINAAAEGSYTISLQTKLAGSEVIDESAAMVAMVNQVSVGGGKSGEPSQPPQPPAPPQPASGGLRFPPSPLGTYTVDPETDNEINFVAPDGQTLKISIPRNFYASVVTFVIAALPKATVNALVMPPDSLDLSGSYAFSVMAQDGAGKTVDTFLKPLQYTFGYTAAQVASHEESTFVLYRLQDPPVGWLESGGSRNTTLRIISTAQDRLSMFGVFGTKINPISPDRKCGIADINCDGRVDLVDFSILMFNWGTPKNPAADLNQDGSVDLVDFSIMMYWWTE